MSTASAREAIVSERDTFRPGERAPESGIYRVVHYAHRLPHDVTIPKDTMLPPCGHCGERARFVFLHPAPVMTDDYDFRPSHRPRDGAA